MQAALIVARTLHFWATAFLFGGAGFLLALGRRNAVAVPGLRVAAPVAAISGLAWFALVFVDLTGGIDGLGDPEAWSAFFDAPFGMPWLVRVCLCGAAFGLTLVRAPSVFLATGTLLLLDQAWLGHAAAAHGTDAAAQIALYWVHVLAGSAWVGALTMVCILAAAEGRVPRDGLALFSKYGVVLVAVLLASGIANAWVRGMTPGDLATTDYGRILVAKLALFAGMIALATTNRRRSRQAASASLVATVGRETFLGLTVLALAAILGVTEPR